jgi:hypothetical protein
MIRGTETGMQERLTLVTLSPSVSRSEVIEAGDDPLNDLLTEFQEYELPETTAPVIVTPPLVAASMKDEQMWLALDGQMSSLREGLQRLHFYLTDVDDSVRR